VGLPTMISMFKDKRIMTNEQIQSIQDATGAGRYIIRLVEYYIKGVQPAPVHVPQSEPDRTAQLVRPLPETMSRDEMLQHYSAHANLCAHEALQYQRRIRDLEKVLSAAPVPPGWKLVPVEPTPRMVHAGWEHHPSAHGDTYVPLLWKAMIAASPEVPR